MGEDQPAETALIVRRARRRATFQSVRKALSVVLALMFLSAAGGFCLGMWQEVAAAPDVYAHLRADAAAPLLERWAVRAAALLADLQDAPPHPQVAARPRDPAVPTPRTFRSQRPAPPKSNDAAKPTPQWEPPDPVDTLDPDPSPEAPPSPGLHKTQPDPPPLPEEEPARPPEIRPKPTPTVSEYDRKTAEMLEKAHKVFRVAWNYLRKAGPTAPSRGRGAAGRKAIRYLLRARKLYEAVLRRKPAPDLRKRIEARLVDINRRLYWARKFAEVR